MIFNTCLGIIASHGHGSDPTITSPSSNFPVSPLHVRETMPLRQQEVCIPLLRRRPEAARHIRLMAKGFETSVEKQVQTLPPAHRSLSPTAWCISPDNLLCRTQIYHTHLSPSLGVRGQLLFTRY